MKVVNMYEAKTNLSQLVKDAIVGKDIIIGKNGVPLVKLTPVNTSRPSRKSGQLKGKIWMSKDFNELPEWFLSYFSEPPRKKRRV